MSILALILLIIATVLFVVGGNFTTAPHWFNSVNLGLAFLTVGLIVVFASSAKSHKITFGQARPAVAASASIHHLNPLGVLWH